KESVKQQTELEKNSAKESVKQQTELEKNSAKESNKQQTELEKNSTIESNKQQAELEKNSTKESNKQQTELEKSNENVSDKSNISNENISEKNEVVQSNSDDIKQIYLGENWNDTVREFVEKYPLAKSFVTDIGKELLTDQTLACQPLCLELALNRVLTRAYIAPADIINNQEFREKFVFDNKEIQSIIVNNYLENLEKSKPPKAITSRGQITLTPPDKPRSIEEAGKIMTKMLQNRRI
ncbi:MAG: hypothetical protein RSB61_03980, partial [Clostridia bacterium]